MKFESLKVVLIALVASASTHVLAEALAEKEKRIETGVNVLFQEAIKAAAAELDADQTVSPFAVVLRSNGKVGYFSATDENKKLSINEQAARIRRMLKDLAISQQIEASTFGMYATVSQEKVSESGLIFEIEHKDGVSLMRFLPVSEGKGQNDGKLVFELERIQTTTKSRDIFVDSIVKQK